MLLACYIVESLVPICGVEVHRDYKIILECRSITSSLGIRVEV